MSRVWPLYKEFHANGEDHLAEDFVHRCGRTGRAGKSGKAVTFFTGENHERALAGEFMRVLRDVGAPVSLGSCKLPTRMRETDYNDSSDPQGDGSLPLDYQEKG